MGYILHGLTAVLVVLKALGEIDWSWWYVLLPSILSVGLGLFVLLVVVLAVAAGVAKVK